MKAIKKYAAVALLGLSAVAISSCSEEKLGPSIFPEVDETLDPNSSTYKFDKWLNQTYREPYNLDFLYRMEDVGTNMNYNLVPANYEQSVDLAVLCKYLWFDVYNKIAGEEFLKQYGPRILHLVGSPAMNAISGTEIVGLAEGGVKVTLFKVNDLDVNNIAGLNELYFKTMHHEFAHILHQTKTIPVTFRTYSAGFYDGSNWQSRDSRLLNSQGFVTPYASSAVREDFAETIANYIVQPDWWWANIYDMASRGWATDGDPQNPDATYYCYYYYDNNVAGDENLKYVPISGVVTETDEQGNVVYYVGRLTDSDGNRIVAYPVQDDDEIDGVAIINQKIEDARQWMRTEFNVDLDKLREEVQSRQQNYLEQFKAIRAEIENMQ